MCCSARIDSRIRDDYGLGHVPDATAERRRSCPETEDVDHAGGDPLDAHDRTDQRDLPLPLGPKQSRYRARRNRTAQLRQNRHAAADDAQIPDADRGLGHRGAAGERCLLVREDLRRMRREDRADVGTGLVDLFDQFSDPRRHHE
jgi:hypothetical protein